LGLRKAPSAPTGPVFLGITGGLQRLIDTLATALHDVRLSAPVSSIRSVAGGGYLMELPDGDQVEADAVVVSVPSYAAANLLSELSPAASRALSNIRHASVVTVALAYPLEAVDHPLDGAGMLVPRVDGRLLTACTWSTSKWPALAQDGMVMLRASAGRDGDERAMDMGDDEVVRRVHDELAQALGLRGRPATSSVIKWLNGFPQYDVGHQARVATIEGALEADAPGVIVAGAAYRGLGIAACIEQARKAADSITG